MGADRNTMKTKFKGGLGWGEAEKRFCVLANSVRENGLWATTRLLILAQQLPDRESLCPGSTSTNEGELWLSPHKADKGIK